MSLRLRLAGAVLAVDRVHTTHQGNGPFVFQHGMGGDSTQPLGYLGTGQAPCPILAINARGHGTSSDATAQDCRFDRFADDVIAVADQLGISRFGVGGISMGAGTAINLAVRHPDRISSLVLCRPAWLDEPQEAWNRDVYQQIAELLEATADEASGPQQALEAFSLTSTYTEVLAQSPAAAASLRSQFTRPRAAHNTNVLRRMPADPPTTDRASWATLQVPTLVIGHRDDPFHPYPIAQEYADTIPTAQLVTVPSKDASPQQFTHQIHDSLTRFLRTQAAARP